MKRTLVRGSLFLAVAALATSGMAMTAGAAAPPQQTCKKLTGSVTITPGLTATAHKQSATASGNLTGCTVASKTGGSAVLKAKLTLPANSSCVGLAQGKQTLKLAATATWKNKKTSTLSLTAKTGSGKTALDATITGKVTKGLFANHTVTTTIKVAPKSGQTCAPGHPIKNLTFTSIKPFVIH